MGLVSPVRDVAQHKPPCAAAAPNSLVGNGMNAERGMFTLLAEWWCFTVAQVLSELIVRRSSRKRVFVWGVQRPMLRGVARGLRPVVDVPASVPQRYFDVQLSGYPYG